MDNKSSNQEKPKKKKVPRCKCLLENGKKCKKKGDFILIISGYKKKFQSMDIWTIGLDMNGDQSIQNFDVGNQFLAFFIGSEENGLSKEIQNKLDIIVKINMNNTVESLNASVAAAIAMNHFFKKK